MWSFDDDPALADEQYDQAMKEILDDWKPIAIVGCTDYAARHAYRTIDRRQMKIPRDISSSVSSISIWRRRSTRR